MEVKKGICPLCGRENNCSYAKGLFHEGCWCETTEVPMELRERIPEELRGKSCICKECVMEYKRSQEK